MDEIYTTLRSMQRKAGTGIALLLILIIASLPVFRLCGAYGFIPIALAVPAGIVGIRAQRTYTRYFKENVVRGVLEEVFTDLTFTPERGISSDVVYGTGMMRQGDIYHSNDLITGYYKGVGVTQSDVDIEEEHTDSDGDRTTTTLFRGRWMIFEFNKEFRCDMQIVSRGFWSARRKGGLFSKKENKMPKVEFENEAFNKVFTAYAHDQQEAFYLITPAIMDALLKLKEGVRAPLMLGFVGGSLHIALQNGKDAFEAKLFGKLDPEKERQRILADTRVITDFVDEMALDRDIYKQS